MISQELIEEAKEKYPIGTMAECLYDLEFYVIASHNHEYYAPIEQREEIWFNDGNDMGICVYKNNKWAAMAYISEQ